MNSARNNVVPLAVTVMAAVYMVLGYYGYAVVITCLAVFCWLFILSLDYTNKKNDRNGER